MSKQLNIFSYLFIIIISFLSIGLTYYFELHNYDSMHDGLVYYEAIKVLNEKIPYKDFFLSHGLFAPYLNALIIKIFNSTIYLTSFYNLLFLLSSFFLFLLIKNFSLKLAIFSFLVFFLIHPYTSLPWNTYLVFFFLTLGIYLFSLNKNLYFFLSSISFSFCYLSSDSFLYALIIIFLFSLFLAIKFYFEENRKNLIFSLLFLMGFLFVFIIYIILIFIYNIDSYIVYNFTLPSAFFDNQDFAIIKKILFSSKLFLKNSVTEIFINQKWFFFLIFVFNSIFILNYIFSPKKLIKENIIILISFISLLMFYMIIYKANIFRLMNGAIIGLVPILYFVNRYRSNILFRVGIFFTIILLGINFFNSSKLKFITNIDYKLTEISSDYNFLDKKKLKKNYHIKYKNLEKISLNIKENCKIENAVNFSNDGFLSYILERNFFLIQKHPLLRNDEREFKIEAHINSNFFNDLISNLNEDNLLIYSEIDDLSKNLASKKFNVNFEGLSFIKLMDNNFIFYPKNCNLR